VAARQANIQAAVATEDAWHAQGHLPRGDLRSDVLTGLNPDFLVL